ncbi:MAG: hypothetical protein NC078_08750 [Ruminococcus sp.]|nr:hypothetical protein [Ruminococcus sp.]
MSNLNMLTTLAYVKGSMAVDSVKNKLVSFNNDERGVEGFVVALILVAIAAVLALVFKDNIKDFMDQVTGKINETLDAPKTTTTT